MIVGIPRETHRNEFRVGLTPFGVARLKSLGCEIVVEHDAGASSRFRDADNVEAGARIVYDREEVHGRADLVCQVAPVTAGQAALLRPEAAVSGFMHVGVMPLETLRILHERRITVLGWEAVEDEEGVHPIRRALAEIGGMMAVQWEGTSSRCRPGGAGSSSETSPASPPRPSSSSGWGSPGGPRPAPRSRSARTSSCSTSISKS